MTRFAFDRFDPAPRATIGLLILSSDETAEQDLRRLVPVDGVAIHTARVENAGDITTDSLAAMAKTIPAAARRLPPSARFDAVGYACTSGTSIIGADRVAALVREGVFARAVTDPLTALRAACAALGVARLAFLSPYVEEVSDRLRGALADGGIATPVFGSFGEGREEIVARIAPASIREAALTLGRDAAAEAVFLSCTNLPTLSVIEEIETALGKPVLASNQVLGWHLCRLAGLGPMAMRGGRLTEV
jgi:maleate isomerase